VLINCRCFVSLVIKGRSEILPCYSNVKENVMLKNDLEADAKKFFGEAEGSGEAGVKKYIEELYWNKKLSTSTIARRYNATDATLRAVMRKLNIKRKATGGGVYFKDALKENGYLDLNDFFGRNARKTKMDMSRILGVSFGSLCAHYDKWIDSLK